MKQLYEKKASVLFSTQILNVAQYAEKEFDAKCFYVDKKHKFQKGIEGGGLDKLLKEEKLSKYLK